MGTPPNSPPAGGDEVAALLPPSCGDQSVAVFRSSDEGPEADVRARKGSCVLTMLAPQSPDASWPRCRVDAHGEAMRSGLTERCRCRRERSREGPGGLWGRHVPCFVGGWALDGPEQ